MHSDSVKVRRGDIVLVDLDPKRGSEQGKTRPALVIQNDTGNRHSHTTIVAPISKGHTGYPFHVNLPGTIDALDTNSHVQLEQIRTVDIQARVVTNRGEVPDALMTDVDDAIRVSLGLDE